MFKIHFDLQYISSVDGFLPHPQSFDVDFLPGDFQRFLLNLDGHCICVSVGDAVVYGDKFFKKLLDDDTEI